MSQTGSGSTDAGTVLTPDSRGYVHATTVSIDGRGVMLIGLSGAGKSSLALELIGLGALLVADDRTRVEGVAGTAGNGLVAHVAQTMAGMIEARGLGLIRVPSIGQDCQVPVHLVVDLSRIEDQRLPPSRPVTIVAEQAIETVWRVDASHFPSALFYLIKHRSFEEDHD